MNPAVFHCVHYFDPFVEEFVIGGIFTKRSDAEECLASFESSEHFKHAAIGQCTLDGLKKQLLEAALQPVKSIIGAKGLEIARALSRGVAP